MYVSVRGVGIIGGGALVVTAAVVGGLGGASVLPPLTLGRDVKNYSGAFIIFNIAFQGY